MTDSTVVDKKSKITHNDIIKSWVLWEFFSQSCYNYERLQALGFCHSMLPIITKLYNNSKEELKSALKRHLNFFNTEPNFGCIIHGITIAMEEEKASGAPITDEAINSIKTGLMGPMAGIGDTLTQGTIAPILISIGVSLASDGNILGPILYTMMMAIIIWGIGYTLWVQGYTLGKNAVERLLEGGLLNRLIIGAGVLGCGVIGALTAQFVSLSTPIKVTIGETQIALQTEVLDKLMPKLLPLLITLLVVWLLNKKQSPTMIMVYMVIIGAVGALIGLF